jgi:magnesium chelatase family protein
VVCARERQAARLRDDGVTVNAHMSIGALRRHATPEGKGEEMLRRAVETGMLSARGQHRVLRVARTIADLNGKARVGARDVGAALALRPEGSPAPSRAA